jgi:hypothetical protein
MRNVKGIAQALGLPDDPVVERAFVMLREGIAEIDQMRHGFEPLSPFEALRMEWGLAQRIVETVRGADDERE